MQNKQTNKQQKQKELANIVVALYNYEMATDEDLSFKAGDHLEIIGDHQDTRGDWWFARNKATNLEGFIPSNYVEKLNLIDEEGQK